jgi:hypothetical protein
MDAVARNADRFWLMPISLRNSSFRISPGWGLRSCAMITSFVLLRPSVIVRDLDIFSVALGPSEADAPLIVDPNAHLSCPVIFQSFEPIARCAAPGKRA